MGPTSTLLKKIKNESHNTIHTFKNYFAIVFSVFSFSNNKFNPNGPNIVFILFYFFTQKKKFKKNASGLGWVTSRVGSGRVGLIHKKHWSGYESTCFCFGSKNRVWVRYFSGRVESIRLENSNPFCHVYKQLCTRFAVVQLKDLVPLSLSLSLVWVWLILSMCVSRERL